MPGRCHCASGGIGPASGPRIGLIGALALALEAACLPSRAAVADPGLSCSAAWLPAADRPVRWSRLDATQAVLTIGAEIVARLDLLQEGIRLHPRDHPQAPLPGTVLADDDPSRLWIDARIPLDSSCVLSVRGQVPLAQSGRAADQAEAWRLAGRAADAEAGDDPELASRLAAQAFDRMSEAPAPELAQKVELAAFAAEKLLRAGHRDAASALLSAASEAEASGLKPDHPSRLRLALVRARALSFSDRNEDALALRLALQPEVLAIFGASSDESLSNRLRIANLRLELGDYGQGRADLEALRESMGRDREAGDALRVSTIRALANALGLLDLEQDSVGLLARLRAELIAAYGPGDGRVVDVDEQIARMDTRLEQFESALQGASRVFLWRAERRGFADVRTLQAAWMLALLYKELGRNDTARALADAMLQQSDRAGTAVPRQLMLRTLAVLGSIEGAEGNVEAAEQILRSAWQQYAAIVGDNSDDTARALMGYALVLVQNGRLERICPVVEDRFDDSRTGARVDLQLRALSKVVVGLCRLARSDSPGAVQQALAGLQGGWNDLSRREGAGSSTALYALSTFAWANYRLGNRQAAKQLLQQLVELAEQSRRAAPAGSLTRDYWFSRWMTDHSQNLGYRTLALLYAQDGELDEALRIAELARDRRLRDRFFERSRTAGRRAALAPDRLDALASEIQALDGRLALEADIVERVKLESRRTLAVAERDALERQAGGREPSRRELPALVQLRAQLDARTALASIQLSGDHGWAVVVTRDAPVRFLTLDHEPDLDVAIRAWVGLLGGAPLRAWPMAGGRLAIGYERPASALGHYLSAQALAERVSRAMLRPLLQAAPTARRLVIVADDDLNGVPFGAMPLEDGAAAIDRVDISYAPSLATYAALSGAGGRRRPWTRDLLSLAADGAVGAAPALPEGAAGPRYEDPAVLMLEYASAHPLPFASKEVEAASGNFAAARTTVVRGDQASKARLAQASGDGSLLQYRYVHIAAHGFSLPHDPERSMLILNAPAAAGAAARVLTAAELANLRMGSELLVLAACRTGVGRYEPGQGPLGFAFAALAAGNHAAVLSLWEVADDLTQRFMSGLFERLKRGMEPSAALAATQREFAHDPDPRVNHPGTWAAFMLYGRS